MNGHTSSDKKSSSLPWVEKYRPETLDDLVSQEAIISILNKLIDSNRLPHLLFYGPPGTGKTSTILACARRIYGKNFSSMTLEMNASDDRGIDVVREQIKNFASTRRLFSSGMKLVILDEADAMTSDAQFALRRVIEQYTRHTRFCMICNYVSKIIPALQSRCMRFRFGPLRSDQVQDRLNEVIDKEGVAITPEGKESILKHGNGDMRRILNLLQSTSMAYDEVTLETVHLTSGSPLPDDVEAVLHQLLNSSFKESYQFILGLAVTKGYALADLLSELVVLVSRVQLPPAVLCPLLSELSNIEYRLSSGASDKLQLGALVGAFVKGKYMMSNP
uniref:AAA+ ATPase domain-containing protein n=1 Tax=Fibrocapsa japonica TaxID=94617 RepID=A0A7S2XZS5_9STRA